MNGQVKISFLCVENSGGINKMMLRRLPAYDFFYIFVLFCHMVVSQKKLIDLADWCFQREIRRSLI